MKGCGPDIVFNDEQAARRERLPHLFHERLEIGAPPQAMAGVDEVVRVSRQRQAVHVCDSKVAGRAQFLPAVFCLSNGAGIAIDSLNPFNALLLPKCEIALAAAAEQLETL